MSADGGAGRSSGGGRTFVAVLAGLVLGAALAVGALASGLLPFDVDVDAGGAGPGEATPGESAEPSPTAPTAAASGDVPPSCLAAAEYNEAVSTALDGVAVGVRDQDALAVEQGLDAIADIKPDMDTASQECQALAGAGGAAEDTSQDASADESGEESEDESGDDSGSDGATTPSPTGTP